LEVTKTVLSLMLVMITILTAITTTIAAVYAGGDDDDDDNNNRDGNKQKAEDDSAAAIADCDDNEVERAGFDCIAIAANDVEIETEPPEESATLRVCKNADSPDFSPEDFTFTVTGNNPSPAQFEGNENCVDVDIRPGEYTITEATDFTGGFDTEITENSDCVQDPTSRQRATGEIQAGETQECTFRNFRD
jgi:hypothetical protein